MRLRTTNGMDPNASKTEGNIATVTQKGGSRSSTKTARHANGPLSMCTPQLFGFMLLLSVASPIVGPTLNQLSELSNNGVEEFSTGMGGILDVMDDLPSYMKDGRFFHYSGRHTANIFSAPDVLEVEAQRQRREDDEEEEEEEEGKNECGGTNEITTPVTQCSEHHHSSASTTSSIGEGDSSAHLALGSVLCSAASTPREVAIRKRQPPPQEGSCYGTSSDFGHLLESVLLGAFAFLALPEVITLLATNKAINRLVKRYFAVNEQGVLSIPAFIGRPSPVHRYDNNNNSNNNNNNNKKVDAGVPPKSPAKAIRLFFGQQRRDNHPSSLRHLLNFLVPDMMIPHMEAHTNPLSGRGKGCSWVFVTSQADAKRLISFNKLLFLDLNEDGEEVYLLAPPRSKGWLQEHVEEVGERPFRSGHLPRQAMVVEVPEKPSVKRKKAVAEQKQLQKNQQQEQREEEREQEQEMQRERRQPIPPAPIGTTEDALEEEEERFARDVVTPSLSEDQNMQMVCEWDTGLRVHCRVLNQDARQLTSHWHRCWPHDNAHSQTQKPNVYTCIVETACGQFRHDPYLYDPLRAPTTWPGQWNAMARDPLFMKA